MPWATCIQRSVTSTMQDTYEKETYKPAFELQPKTWIQWASKPPSLCLREKGQNRACHIRKSSIGQQTTQDPSNKGNRKKCRVPAPQ